MKKVELTSAGPIAFGPDGILMVSDPMAATIWAFETGDTEGDAAATKINVDDIQDKIASMMGAKSDDVRVNDLAVNSSSGHAYLSVTRGSGADEVSSIIKVNGKGELSPVKLGEMKHSKAVLENAAENKDMGRRGNARMSSITDMAYVDGTVYVAGLSNEEFASNLRSIPYPFEKADNGTAIEIYHGAHGKYETRAPVRTFTSYVMQEELNILAAYTCTPLVRIPTADLKPGSKVRGETIAELGNWNKPLDMIVYMKKEKPYVLMANSHRGVMKMELGNMNTDKLITTKIKDKAGVEYETIEDLKNVVQLDKLNDTHGLILTFDKETKKSSLKTIPLP